jgi:hypothetical protein
MGFRKQLLSLSRLTLAHVLPEGDFLHPALDWRLAAAQEQPAGQNQLDTSGGSASLAGGQDALSFDAAARLNMLRKRGLYSYAEAVVNALLELRQKTLGPDHPEVAIHLPYWRMLALIH